MKIKWICNNCKNEWFDYPSNKMTGICPECGGYLQKANKKVELTKEWVFVHQQLERFLECVSQMDNGDYKNQPKNSIIPTTETILDYFGIKKWE
jgi:threonine synthase